MIVARRVPPLLAAGAQIALVAPAGPLRGQDDLDRAMANVRTLGWEGVVAPRALARAGYFAGDDEARAADFNDALHDARIDGVWCLRGGYGAVRALERGIDSCGVAPGARALRSGDAIGRLEGGNLAVLAGLVGTPYLPSLDGALLVLEDVNEPVYRIDRMFAQLRMSGALRGVRGIIFGQCT